MAQIAEAGHDKKNLTETELELAKEYFNALVNNDKQKYLSLFIDGPDPHQHAEEAILWNNAKIAYLHDYDLFRLKELGIAWEKAQMGPCYKDEYDDIVIQFAFSADGMVLAEMRIGKVEELNKKMYITMRSRMPILLPIVGNLKGRDKIPPHNNPIESKGDRQTLPSE